jgi:hypothetical protein
VVARWSLSEGWLASVEGGWRNGRMRRDRSGTAVVSITNPTFPVGWVARGRRAGNNGRRERDGREGRGARYRRNNNQISFDAWDIQTVSQSGRSLPLSSRHMYIPVSRTARCRLPFPRPPSRRDLRVIILQRTRHRRLPPRPSTPRSNHPNRRMFEQSHRSRTRRDARNRRWEVIV